MSFVRAVVILALEDGIRAEHPRANADEIRERAFAIYEQLSDKDRFAIYDLVTKPFPTKEWMEQNDDTQNATGSSGGADET